MNNNQFANPPFPSHNNMHANHLDNGNVNSNMGNMQNNHFNNFGSSSASDLPFYGGGGNGNFNDFPNSNVASDLSGGAIDTSPSKYDDEPPLLEELGVDFSFIFRKTKAVLLPYPTISEDADLAGPLCFCLLLGTCLLLHGKIHFGYIYGFGMVGSTLMYLILNLMSPTETSVSFDKTCSILGYSLLPIVMLAFCNAFLSLKDYGVVGLVLSLSSIFWCTFTATRYLVAYPVALLYACFSLLTVF